jgi:predicted DCC family thiol-disulfide oxidoreductase YuxK
VMPWYLRVVGFLIFLFPHFIREAVYGLIASKRYILFGKKEACSLPSPSLKAKFLHPV